MLLIVSYESIIVNSASLLPYFNNTCLLCNVTFVCKYLPTQLEVDGGGASSTSLRVLTTGTLQTFHNTVSRTYTQVVSIHPSNPPKISTKSLRQKWRKQNLQ